MSNSKNGTLGTHFFYVCLILVLVIILLVSTEWSQVEGFARNVGVVSTVTSILLGLLAIIYAFVTNSSMGRSLGSIESSAEDIRKIGQDLKGVLSDGQRLQGQAEEQGRSLHLLVGNLESAVQGLVQTTSEIAGKVDSLPERVSAVAKEARALHRGGNEDVSQRLTEIWTEELIADYLNGVSSLGLGVLRALNKAREDGIYCDLKEVLKTEFTDNFDYIWGFIVGFGCTDMAKLEYAKKENDLTAVRFSDPSPAFLSALSKEWMRRISLDVSGKGVRNIGKRLDAYFSGRDGESKPDDQAVPDAG